MIYYAHSMKIYNSSRESEEFKFIQGHFKGSEVVNPNGDIPWMGTMKPYRDAVKRSKMVVLSEFEGCIGRGVYEEALTAIQNGIPVKCIRYNNGQPKLVDVNALREEDRRDWAVRYARVIKAEER